MTYVPHSAEALEYVDFEELEHILGEHLSPGLHALALAWCNRACDIQVERLINAICAHDPGLAGLCAHVLVDLESTDGLCKAAKARLKVEDAA
jgi:hypothetical protein